MPSRLRILFSLLVIASLAVVASADTIRLKNGSIIKGHIASFNGGQFVVEVGEGSHRRQLKFAANEIESIVFDPPASAGTKTQPVIIQPVVRSTPTVPASYPKPEPKPSVSAKIIPPTAPDRVAATSSGPAPARNNAVPPIKWNTKVRADNSLNGWTNSGWVIKKGQRVRIIADGTVSLGKGKSTTPSGDAELNDDKKLLKSVPTGALIAVIGDDNNDFMYIGAEREFTASRDGALFLGINEGDLGDNSGTFDVSIEIVPES